MHPIESILNGYVWQGDKLSGRIQNTVLIPV